MMPNQQFLILGLYLVTACNLAVGDRVVETAEAFLTSSEVSTLCKESVDIFVSQLSEPLTSLTKEGFWALKMYDSYGKFPNDGELMGNFFHFGDYNSCLEVEADDGLARGHGFRGQFCSVYSTLVPEDKASRAESGRILSPNRGINPFFPGSAGLLPAFQAYLSFGVTRFGICVPSTCSYDDVAAALANATSSLPDLEPSDGLVLDSYPLTCHNKINSPPLTAGDIVYICVLSVFVILVLVSTMYEVFHLLFQRGSGQPNKLLVGLSSVRNVKAVLSTARAKNHIGCFDGMRLLSMAWVVVPHAYIALFGQTPINNAALISELTESFFVRIILNGAVNVDSFLFMGGFLLGFLTFKELDRSNGRLNFLTFYLHRWLRLTGAYAMVLGFATTLYKFLDVGPGAVAGREQEYCQDVWWMNLLYINNFVDPTNPETACLQQTWYLAAEMQMFIFSPLLLIPLWWIHKKLGKVFGAAYAFTWVAAFTALLAVLTAVKEWPMNALTDLRVTDYPQWNYVAAWCRCQPYIVGILLGFIMNKTRNTTIKINKWLVVALWAAAAAVALSICYGLDTSNVLATDIEPPLAASIAFNALHRLGWALSLSWVVFACYHGYGGWANTFLSWEGFMPLSKISFVIYLIHLAVINVFVAQITFNFEATHLFQTFLILSVFSACVVLGFAIEVIIEMPYLHMEKALFEWILHRKKESS